VYAKKQGGKRPGGETSRGKRPGEVSRGKCPTPVMHGSTVYTHWSIQFSSVQLCCSIRPNTCIANCGQTAAGSDSCYWKPI